MYSELKEAILSCSSLQSLCGCRNRIYEKYRIGQLREDEYYQLVKIIDHIVVKGVKCERVGL